jgi:hypothetical protein
MAMVVTGKGSHQFAVFVPSVGRCRAIRALCATFTLIAAGVLLSASISAAAELSPPSEYEIKAAFLYNFIKFTEWPPADLGKAQDPIIIGIVGKDPFGAVLDKTVAGEKVHDRAILVRRFPRMDAAAANSHVLFISASETNNLPAILKLLEGDAVLTVSDMENFAERGGVINLKNQNNKIVFEINLDAAKRVGLVMNAQLLKLAKIVKARS